MGQGVERGAEVSYLAAMEKLRPTPVNELLRSNSPAEAKALLREYAEANAANHQTLLDARAANEDLLRSANHG